MTQFTFTGTLHISTIAAGSVEEHWAVEAYQDEEVHKQEPDHWEVGWHTWVRRLTRHSWSRRRWTLIMGGGGTMGR